jgi:hypothetical protein
VLQNRERLIGELLRREESVEDHDPPEPPREL